MSDQSEKKVATPDEITEFLKKEFVFTDNIPEDTDRRRDVTMEARASILIDSYCTSGRFPTFMKAGRYDGSGWVFPLPKPFVHETKTMDQNFNDIIIKWSFREFVVYSDSILKSDYYNQTSRWRLFVNDDPANHITNGVFPNRPSVDLNANMKSHIIEIQEAFADTYSSLWQLCKAITPYNTPEKVCRFFGNAPFAFAPLKLNNSVLRPDIFHKQDKAATEYLEQLRTNNNKCSEETLIQWILSQIISKSSQDSNASSLYSKLYEKWLKMLYTFKNEYGEPIMKVAKLYEKSQTKSLIPMTMWMRNHSTTDQLFCVPLPEEKQPLYNLDQLISDKESPVILTDSIELADANKLEGVIFTSFICDHGQYEQVDWTPLLNRTVYYLVTNHSGMRLESAYLRARKLAEYFKNEQDINLKFIQLKVDYSEKQHFASVDDILLHYRNGKPAVKAESVEIFENDEAFDLQYEKAVAFINTKTIEWWESHSKNTEELRIVKDETEKRKAIDYVLHPILIRGEATMIYAKKSTGKSAFALSLAALATSSFTLGPKRILKEKWWSIPRKQSKVLYLDFENKERTLEDRYKDFAYPQWPEDKTKREECKRNLIIEDMTKCEGLDYSEPANHQKIIDMLEKAKTKGNAGQPVDLLVIDTYTKFVKNEDPQTSDNFSMLLNKIRGMNIAVLIVHHSNEEGLPRGYKKMLDDLYFNIRLYRNDDDPHDLTEPLKVKYVSFRSPLSATMWKEFEIKFVAGKWKVVDPVGSENEAFQAIVKAYRERDYDDESIWKMLGVGSSFFYEHLKGK